MAHCTEYGFVFQSSEIYDGLSAVYDYGQNGVELKNNIKRIWWREVVQKEANVFGLDSAILMHPEIWRASGNEPAWMLAFGAEFVQVKRVGKPEVVVPAAPLTLEPGLATFSASKDNQSVSLRFERQLCYDTMADAVFGWTASVTANGETLKGCAWQR